MDSKRTERIGSKLFSVLLPLHAGEKPQSLQRALKSLAEQTLLPTEVVLAKHGHLPVCLEEVIDSYRDELKIQDVTEDVGSGVGKLMQKGLERCRYNLVVRMDSDDISRRDRFQLQFDYLSIHPEVHVLGGWISEFETDETRVSGYRIVPLAHNELVHFSLRRNPMNHVTVIFQKPAVLAAGGYQDLRGLVDYWLWARMMANGARFANIPEYLVHVRKGEEFGRRRGGFWYLKSELQLQLWLRRIGFINSGLFARNVLLRGGIRLVPSPLRHAVYQRYFRDRPKG